jgi:hypothetical protein
MAEKKDPCGKEPFPRKNEPKLSHNLDDDLGAITVEDTGPAFGEVVKKHQDVPWLKKNANVLILSAAGVVSLVLLLVLGSLLGWFGGGQKSKPAAVAVATPTVQPQPQASSSPAQPARQSGQPAPQTGQPATAGGPQIKTLQPPPGPQAPGQEPKKEEPKKPSLPDDVAKWKKNDYYRARKKNDSKLVQAVVYLGQTFRGKETAARGLTELLKPLPPEKPAAGATPAPGPAQPRSPADLTKLVEAIVEALGCNGSPAALDTLEQILAGRFATDDDKAAVEAAVKTLAAHPSDENDALLFRVLTAADALRPNDRAGPWPAKDLQPKALEWVKPAASSGLRTKLAEWLADRAGGFDPKEPMCAFLMTADPHNCGAQMVFYKKADTPKDTKVELEKQFLDYSSKALARYLKVPEDSLAGLGSSGISAGQFGGPAPMIIGGAPPGANAGPGQPAKPAEVNPAPHVAGQLWSDGFRTLLEPQLGAKSLEQQSQLLLLAGTIPCESTRAILAKILRKRWYEGPKPLETAGLADRLITDPGLLVAIKMGGPRKDSPSTSPPAAAGTGRRVNAPAGGGPRSAELKKKLDAEQGWMDLSAKLVDSWRKRLYAAAQAKEKAAAHSGGQADDAAAPKLPEGFELGPEATVKAAYHLSWPDDAPPEITKLDLGPLDVYYIRAEESNRIKKLKTFYVRQAKVSASETRMIDKSIWIDSLRTAMRKDRRRSLDVLITRTSGGTGNVAENNDEADFLVEALIIEIREPTKE